MQDTPQVIIDRTQDLSSLVLSQLCSTLRPSPCHTPSTRQQHHTATCTLNSSWLVTHTQATQCHVAPRTNEQWVTHTVGNSQCPYTVGCCITAVPAWHMAQHMGGWACRHLWIPALATKPHTPSRPSTAAAAAAAAPVAAAALLLPLLHLHAVAACDYADVHHVQEQAVVHHTLQVQDGLAGSMAVLDGRLGGE
jgi:hypothetical protein